MLEAAEVVGADVEADVAVDVNSPLTSERSISSGFTSEMLRSRREHDAVLADADGGVAQVIEAQVLAREYADKVALSDLNLRVEPGEISDSGTERGGEVHHREHSDPA